MSMNYHFPLYALDRELDVKRGVDKAGWLPYKATSWPRHRWGRINGESAVAGHRARTR